MEGVQRYLPFLCELLGKFKRAKLGYKKSLTFFKKTVLEFKKGKTFF